MAALVLGTAAAFISFVVVLGYEYVYGAYIRAAYAPMASRASWRRGQMGNLIELHANNAQLLEAQLGATRRAVNDRAPETDKSAGPTRRPQALRVGCGKLNLISAGGAVGQMVRVGASLWVWPARAFTSTRCAR